VRPSACPRGIAWQDFPTLATLQERSGLSLGRLRAVLAEVPCFRCADKSVRYDPSGAATALDRDDEDGGDEAANDNGPGVGNDNAGGTLSAHASAGAVDQALLLSLSLRMLADSRKAHTDTIRTMQEPLTTGLAMMKTANDISAKRLEHMEGMWDRMVMATESLLSSQHDRDLRTTRQTQNAALRSDAVQLVKSQLPRMLDLFRVSGAAGTALEFIASLDPQIIDGVVASGVLEPNQQQLLDKLRAMLPNKPPPPDSPPS
jgi:hypothetical protein